MERILHAKGDRALIIKECYLCRKPAVAIVQEPTPSVSHWLDYVCLDHRAFLVWWGNVEHAWGWLIETTRYPDGTPHV